MLKFSSKRIRLEICNQTQKTNHYLV